MSGLSRLLRMRPAEVGSRLAEAIRARSEWLGGTVRGPSEPSNDGFLRRGIALHGSGHGSDPRHLWHDFRRRAEHSPFPGLRGPRETVETVRGHRPEAVRRVVAQADDIVDGRLTLLGRRIRLEEPVDWHHEPVTGLRIPLSHWTRIDHLDPETVGECKVLWELGRHQYFLALGQAYALTGEERYSDCFRRHITGWMDENPPGWGIHWSSSLELSYRTIAWIWSLHLFRDASQISDDLYVRCLKFLYLHGRHIERHLSTYFSPNTHLTGEALGLLYLGAIFPELDHAARWRNLGARILREQLPIQVRPDGVYFEQASAYHAYTVDIYLHAYIIHRHLGFRFPRELEKRLIRALEHLRYVIRPDGLVPLIGDDDGGRLLPLVPRHPADFSGLLSVGGHLFRKPELLSASDQPAPESVWLLRAGGLDSALIPCDPAGPSKAFPAGGIYVLRDGWDGRSNYVAVSCGPHGSLGGGHAHADVLSVEICLEGVPVVVDPGTYTYRRNSELRDELRSQGAHNGLIVDAQPWALPDGPFSWKTSVDGVAEYFIHGDDFSFFRGSVEGPAEADEEVCHRRTVFLGPRGLVVIWDRLRANRRHHVEIRFRLSPKLRPILRDGIVRCGSENGPAFDVRFLGAPAGGIELSKAPVSRGYGELVNSGEIVWSQRGEGSQEIVTAFLPAAFPCDIRRVGSGRIAIELPADREGVNDLVLLGPHPGTSVEAPLDGFPALRCDGELVWVRHDSSGKPIRVLGVLTRRLEIEDVILLDGAELSEYVNWCRSENPSEAPSSARRTSGKGGG